MCGWNIPSSPTRCGCGRAVCCAASSPYTPAAARCRCCSFIPRTAAAAGKTYANCFLRTALPPSKRCAKSYDTLRLNVSTPGCQALVSHDDFSVSDTFPEGAATITQLRRWGRCRCCYYRCWCVCPGQLGRVLACLSTCVSGACRRSSSSPGLLAAVGLHPALQTLLPTPSCRPVERVLSAYQFAVDIAAKEVLHLDPAKKNPARRSDFVGTLEVWPWSYLIPWFKRDMAARVRQAQAQGGGVGAWVGGWVRQAHTRGGGPCGWVRQGQALGGGRWGGRVRQALGGGVGGRVRQGQALAGGRWGGWPAGRPAGWLAGRVPLSPLLPPTDLK